jgi:DNA-binding response OmpR family regulator
MRILIVDDYPGLIELYDLGLAARGFEVVGAATAGEALSLAANEAFDAVVLDLQLPDASGSELLRRLRNLPSLDGKPIVGISSFERRDADAAGFDEFLHKPVSPKKLASVLRRLSDHRDGRISA